MGTCVSFSLKDCSPAEKQGKTAIYPTDMGAAKFVNFGKHHCGI
jgi:hypothetical protein